MSHPRWLLIASVVLVSVLGAHPVSAQAVTCANFDSQIWAQSVFDEDPERYAALDLDGDGVACPEWAPGAAPALWTDEVPEDAEPATLAAEPLRDRPLGPFPGGIGHAACPPGGWHHGQSRDGGAIGR